jgi:hypothetical protein
MAGSMPGVSFPPSTGTTCSAVSPAVPIGTGAFPRCIPPDGIATPCSDTSNDPHNCGACGHDCQGGSCASGACQPCVLVQETSVNSIAIDGSDLYFSTEVYDSGSSTSYSNVAKVPLTGGTVTPLACGIQYASSVAVDASTIYFIQFLRNISGSVQSVPRAGGTPTTLATFPTSYPIGMILDGQSLYVSLFTAGGNSVVVVPTNGGPVRPLVSGARLIGEYAAVAYLVTQGNLSTMSLMGSRTTTIASFPDPTAIAFFSSDIYVVNQMVNNDFDGSIVRIPIGGGPKTPMATSLSQPVDLAVDASGIYWGQNNELRRLAAGSESVLYTSPRQSQKSVQVDALAVYWIDTGSGVSAALIMKLAK